MPILSIILPVYNCASYLRECLDSVLAQTFTDWELIAVDDGSQDESLSILEEYAQHDHRISLIHHENHGVSYTRNRGLELAQGKWVAFLDGDDLIAPQFAQALVHMGETLKVDCVCCRRELTENPAQLPYQVVEDAKQITGDERYFTVLRTEYSGYLVNKLFLRELIELSPALRLDPQLAILEDQVFVVRYLARSRTMAVTSSLLCGYRFLPTSAYNQPLSSRKLTCLIGREQVYSVIDQKGRDTPVKAWAWNMLMRDLCVHYRMLQCQPILEKKQWHAYIEKQFLHYKGKYPLNKTWSLRDRCYYLLTALSARFHQKGDANA